MTFPFELQEQRSLKAKVLAAIDQLNKPFDSVEIANLTSVTPSRVSAYLTGMYHQKMLRRSRDSGALNRLKFSYAKPEWDIPGYDLIDRRKTAAQKRRRTNAYSSAPTPQAATTQTSTVPQLSIVLGGKRLEMTVREARALHSELGVLFGDLARTG